MLTAAHLDDDEDGAHVRARLLITLAYSEFEMHGRDRAALIVDDALRAAARGEARDVVALVHELRGLMLIRSGDIDGSLPELDGAIALLDDVESAEQPALLLNRGTVHLIGRNLVAARQDLSRSIELALGAGDLMTEFKARHNLGYAEFLAGNLPQALDSIARADALDVPVSRSVGLLDRSRVLMEAGLLEEAETSLAEATHLLTIERANQDRAEAQLVRAELALMQGRWELAKTHSGRASRDFRRRQSPGWMARADVTRWQSQLDSPRGASRVAREISRQSAASDAAVSPEVALIAAEAHLSLGRIAIASGYLDALAPPRRSDPLSARLHHHLVRAGVARAAEDLPTARRELRAGLSTLARQQARHHSIDLRTAMAVHGGRLAELDLRLAIESRSPHKVFDSLERWRAMSHRRTAVTPPSDPELAGLLSQLRLVSEDIRGAPPGVGTERLRRQRDLLERSVREAEWRIGGDGRSQRATRLRELRPRMVARGDDLISYFVLDEQLGAVSVASGRCTVSTLGPWAEVASRLARIRADLDALAGRLLPAPLRAAVTASLSRDLGRLDALLLPPLAARAHRLVVIPSRTLATVPWGMLPSRRGRATTVSLSATGWSRGLQDAPHPGPLVLAMAGPGLPLAADEVAAVAAAWPGATAVASADGDAESLAAALASYDLVHIAAHGTHNHDNPLFSSIRLAGGPLFAYDVPQDAPIAGHVVLSACDLGMTTPRPGGEVLGLTAALLGMGSRCVVSAVARVDDPTAYATMQRYHRLLASGVDAARALAEADDGDLSHPAPFVCFGSTWASAATEGQPSR
ncbi:MAG: CHAT domain-containing protein [Lapillicoccus sp.]